MSNEAQYFNPIIQAMMGTAQLQQNTAQQGIEKERNKNEAEARKQQLAQSLKQVEYEHEHQTGMLDLQGKQQALAAEVAKLHAILELNKGSSEGLDVGKALQSTSNGNGTPSLTQGLDPTALQTPAGEAQRIQNTAQAQAQGQMNVTLPAQQSILGLEQKNKLELQNNENDFKERLAGKEITSKEKIASLDRNTQSAIANATNATHLQIAGMQYVPTPETLQSMVIAGSTGQIKLNPANPQERAAMSAIEAQGWRMPDPKDIDALKQGQQLIPLFDKLQQFTDSHLSDNRVGAFVKGHAIAAASSAGFNTETQNELNIIKSQALNIGKSVEGMTGGRMPIAQLQLDLDALMSPGITKKDAQQRIQNLRDLYTNKMENVLMPGMPQTQRDLLYKVQGIKPPESFRQNQQFQHTYSGPDGHQIGSNDGHTWYDIGTGKQIQ